MVNARAKGMRNELKAEKELISQGYLTYRVKGSTKFNKNVDIFGLWDIYCIKEKVGPLNIRINCFVPRRTIIKLIQIKTNQKPSLKPFKEFAKKYSEIDCEIWIYKDRKEKEVIML